MRYVPGPFVASMDVDQFILIMQALRDGGDLLSDAYERAERIHEAFYGRRRYTDFESAAQMYYRRHPSRGAQS